MTERTNVTDGFQPITGYLRRHARATPDHRALVCSDAELSYAQLDALTDRVAASLQREGLGPGDVIGICAATSFAYVAVFLGALRAGVVVAPMTGSSTADQLAGMLDNARARLVFIDRSTAALLEGQGRARTCITMDDDAAGMPLGRWLMPAGTVPTPVDIEPQWAFNIIYSSGTTGLPKGILHSHERRFIQSVRLSSSFGYGPEMVLMVATPLYSNATLFTFFSALLAGGTVALMPKFDVKRFVALAASLRATHTMLVPAQYRNIMALPDLDAHDLSSFALKFCMGAPFAASLKAEVLARWPGGLIEFYGSSEGTGSTVLLAHEHPHKLHTVGKPSAGNDIRIVDTEGREVEQGGLGEIVGRSDTMMDAYHGQDPARMRDMEWFDPAGRRFLRSGDIGRFDEDGFLEIVDRKKDMIISGGFNVYPSDVEAVLRGHPAVAEAAVVGVPSERWGETPVAFVVRRGEPQGTHEQEMMAWLNGSVGKTQRVSALHFIDQLPRSEIGKVLKRELRDRYVAMAGAADQPAA